MTWNWDLKFTVLNLNRYQIWDTGLGCIAATNKGSADGKAFTENCTKAFSNIEAVMTSDKW